MQNKQVRLDELPAFINSLAKAGYIISRCVKNGNTGGGYVLVEFCSMGMLNHISRRVFTDERNRVYSKKNLLKIDEKQS